MGQGAGAVLAREVLHEDPFATMPAIEEQAPVASGVNSPPKSAVDQPTSVPSTSSATNKKVESLKHSEFCGG